MEKAQEYGVVFSYQGKVMGVKRGEGYLGHEDNKVYTFLENEIQWVSKYVFIVK